MRNSRLVFLAMTSALAFQGCAHSTLEKQVDDQVSQETAIRTHADLRAEARQLIQSSPGLSDEQRSKLSGLWDATRVKLDGIWSQSLKLRSVLIKDLVATNYNEDEVELIKQRIKKLEDQRLSVTFSAVEQANAILGHDMTASRRRIMEAFFEGRGNRD